MMRRLTVISATVLGMALPALASALSLGEIRVASRLNQPLQAEIALVGAEDLGEFQLAVTPANKADAQKPVWKSLSYGLKDGQLGKQLVLRSRLPLSEPMTRVTVRISWKGGQLEKLYTLMPEPSATGAESPMVAPTATAASRATAAPLVQEDDFASMPEPKLALAAALKPYLMSDPNVARQYGPTTARDTLWNVAYIHRGNPDKAKVNMDQMQVALYRANPQAFGGGMDKILANQYLYVPPASEVAKIPRSTAKAIVDKLGKNVNRLLAGLPKLLPPANWRQTLAISTKAGFSNANAAVTAQPNVLAGEGTAGGRRVTSGSIASTQPNNGQAATSGATTNSNASNTVVTNPSTTSGNGAATATNSGNGNGSNGVNGVNSTNQGTNNGVTSGNTPISPRLPEIETNTNQTPPNLPSHQIPWYQRFDWRTLLWPLLFILAGLGFLLLRRRHDKVETTTETTNNTTVVVPPPVDENAPIGKDTNILLPVPPQESSEEKKSTSHGPIGLTDPNLANFVPGVKPVSNTATVTPSVSEIKHEANNVELPTSITHNAESVPVLNVDAEQPKLPETDMKAEIAEIEDVSTVETKPVNLAPTVTEAETEVSAEDNSTAQLMQEADFHINYGLYDEAARLLSVVLAKDPKNADAKYKRLEALFASQIASEFVPEAEQFQKDHPNDRRWQKLQLMGQQLAPNSPVFQGVSRGNAAMGLDVDLGEANSPSLLATQSQSGQRFTLNQPIISADLELPTFDLGQAPSIPQINSFPTSYLSPEQAVVPVPTFPPIGTIPKPAAEVTPVKVPVNVVETSNPTTRNDVLTGHPNPRFNMDIAPVDDLGLLTNFDTNQVPNTAAESSNAAAPTAQKTPEVSLPEFNTYLELARSYAQLDPRIARELLQDVVERGSELQKNQAQDILGRL